MREVNKGGQEGGKNDRGKMRGEADRREFEWEGENGRRKTGGKRLEVVGGKGNRGLREEGGKRGKREGKGEGRGTEGDGKREGRNEERKDS